MGEITVIDGIELRLVGADSYSGEWIDYNGYALHLEAAWLRLMDQDVPLNPRIVGASGVGKTTLVRAVAHRLGRPMFIFQCTADTRPEDLLITPVLGRDNRIEYRASSVVSAMIVG